MTRAAKRRPPPPLKDLIEVYLMRCEMEGKSVHTSRAYRHSLTRFLRCMEEDGAPTDPSRLGVDHIYRYMSRFSHLEMDSRHKYFREVRAFFNWLIATGYLEDSPFKNIRNVRLPHKIVRPLLPDDVQRLLAACDATPVGLRDRAVMIMLLDTGLRVSELSALNLVDIDATEMRLRVLHGKGNKQRIVPFSRSCLDELRRYMVFRGDDIGPLFYGTNGSRMLKCGIRLEANGIKHMMRRLAARTGVQKVHPHRFRHTFATWAIEQGARELDVQLLLGHSTPDMVRRYTATYNVEQAARRHVTFSPLRLLSTEPS